jgi:hypothetical protein
MLVIFFNNLWWRLGDWYRRRGPLLEQTQEERDTWLQEARRMQRWKD